MSSSTNMPPPSTKGRTPKPPQTDPAPDPNAMRPYGYPNEWRIEFKKQTAKCMCCNAGLAGTKWCVVCVGCRKRICSPCWKGERYNRYDEQLFEGHVQNLDGCWCRFRNNFDARYEDRVNARSDRVRALIAVEKAEAEKAEAEKAKSGKGKERAKGTAADPEEVNSEAETEIQEPVAKRMKLWNGPIAGVNSIGEHRTPHSHDPQTSQVAESSARHRSIGEDSVQQGTPVASPRDLPETCHLHDKTTIIVGAGIIGLSIARELAAQTYNSNTHHEIIVVEKCEGYGEGASFQCAGLIAKHGVPEAWSPLTDLSLESWNAQLKDRKTCAKLAYIPDGVVHVKPKTEERTESNTTAPDWYQPRPEDVFRAYGSDVGKISPPHLLQYLYNECRDMNVHFRFHQELTTIQKSLKGTLLAVDIASTEEGSEHRFVNIPCHNLIVAAGAHTPEALENIVPWLAPKETFANHKQQFDWVCAGIVASATEDTNNVGMVVRSPSAVLAAQPEYNRILVAAIAKGNKPAPQLPEPFLETMDDAEKIDFSLPGLRIGNRLKGILANDQKKWETGSTTISTSFNERPLVDKIPWVVVDDRCDGEDTSSLGVYVAYGFGKHGTTLAPGVATAVRRLVMGDEAGIGEGFKWPAGYTTWN